MANLLSNLAQDLRYATRQLRRAPAFAAIAIATLALGIGANTAIFSLIDQALLRALPVRDPNELVILEGTGTAWNGHFSNHGGDAEAYFTYPMYKDLRDQSHAFEGLIATAPSDIGYSFQGNAQTDRAEIVSGNYFNVLGVEPALGRVFTQADDTAPGANPVAVLSFDFWRNHLGANPNIVGQQVAINGQPFQIVGVAAPRFRSAIWGETPGFFVPMSMLDRIIPGAGKRLTDHTDKWMNILGRLNAGESRTQAETALAPLWHSLRADELKSLGHRSSRFADDYLTRSRLHILPGASGFSYQRDDYQKPLFAIMAMAVLVLLIASVNVGSLLLVRAAARVREFSLRSALGARPTRIVQQLVLEGLLIGLGGGIAGMLLAPTALRAIVHQLNGDEATGAFSTAIDLRLLAFNFVIALAVSLVFSLAPALQVLRPDLTATLKQQSGTGTGTMLTFRRSVVCLQIGLSILLLIGAGLFVRTMQNLRHVDVGFTTAHLVTFGINPKLSGYAPAAVPALHQRVLDTLTALPGVQSVAATDDPELADTGQSGNVSVSGYTAAPEEDYDVEMPWVNSAYFSTLRVPVLAGRIFTEAEAQNSPVAVVNETFAKHFCGTPSACIGRMMAEGGGNAVKLNIQIIGVVRDLKHKTVRDAAVPTYFRPLQQSTTPGKLFLYVRTSEDPAQALSTIRRTMQQLDPTLAVSSLRTMDQQIDDTLTNERMIVLLAISFGILATLLAGIGLYGVLAYVTAQRTREIGVRIALGSTRIAISGIILTDLLKLAGISIAVSVPLAFGLTRLLKSQLFGVSSGDPITYASVVLLVGVVAILAALVPAHRAATVDPVKALRSE